LAFFRKHWRHMTILEAARALRSLMRRCLNKLRWLPIR
jgi:hypothetical protein